MKDVREFMQGKYIDVFGNLEYKKLVLDKLIALGFKPYRDGSDSIFADNYMHHIYINSNNEIHNTVSHLETEIDFKDLFDLIPIPKIKRFTSIDQSWIEVDLDTKLIVKTSEK